MIFFRIHKRLIFLNIVSVIVFIILAFAEVVTNSKPVFDTWAYQMSILIQDPALTSFMLAVSNVFSPTVLLITTVIIFFILFFFHKRSTAYLFLASMAFGLVSVVIFKEIFNIARPVGDISVFGPSFPSAHATGAAIFFMTLLFSLENKIKNETLHTLFPILACGLALLTGISRLYLGVHWVSDVLAGFALGLFWVSFSFLIYYKNLQQS